MLVLGQALFLQADTRACAIWTYSLCPAGRVAHAGLLWCTSKRLAGDACVHMSTALRCCRVAR
jgi:hypothetical protein